MRPETLDSIRTLLLGFAFAGMIGTAFEFAAGRPVSFRLLHSGNARALVSVPLVVFSAPFILVRNAIRGRRFEKRSFAAVMAATVLAGLWSMICGRLVLDAALRLTGT